MARLHVRRPIFLDACVNIPELPPLSGEIENAVDEAYLLQFVGSALAICVLAAVATWARIPRPIERLTPAAARALIADELPDEVLERIWIDAAGDVAVAKAGETGVVLFRVGDSYAARTAPWAQVKAARLGKDRVVIPLGDPAAPAAAFRLARGEAAAPFMEAMA